MYMYWLCYVWKILFESLKEEIKLLTHAIYSQQRSVHPFLVPVQNQCHKIF